MYIRNDGKGESNITQNGFTAYLLSGLRTERQTTFTPNSADRRERC